MKERGLTWGGGKKPNDKFLVGDQLLTIHDIRIKLVDSLGNYA